jgi:hypothetical protein
VKPTSLLFFMIGTIVLFGLAQMMANSIFPVSHPMTSEASGEEMFQVYWTRYDQAVKRESFSSLRLPESYITRNRNCHAQPESL